MTIGSLRRSALWVALLGVLAGAALLAPASSVAFTGHRCSKSSCRYFTSSYHTAKFYYDRRTCDQWQDLSNQYLHGFNSDKRLKKQFDRKKHKPC